MDLVLRAAFTFFCIFIVTRVIGRRELSSLEPFDLVLLVVIGDLIQQGVTQDDYSITSIVLVVGTFTVLQVGVSYLNFRFRGLRPVLKGEPIVVMQSGEPIERNMRRERLTIEEIETEARIQRVGRLSDVDWIVLEPNGSLSFIARQ
jgi:uncharacterized membrane protein YcaP (DUF421 family)